MRLYFPTLAVLLLASPAANAADRISFQGLDGASTKEDVLKVFPQATAKPVLFCRTGQTTWKEYREGEYSCFSLSVGDYVVDNHPYDLTFVFGVDSKLRGATITRSFSPYTEPFSKADLHQQYEGLYKALNYKYGDPVEEPQTLLKMPTDCLFENGDSGSHYSECAEWQSGPSQKYEPGQNHIKLNLSADAPATDPPYEPIKPDEYEGYSGDISITYNFADVRAAGKL